MQLAWRRAKSCGRHLASRARRATAEGPERQPSERNRPIGRGITGRGFQPAMVRAHSRACMVLVINGNSRRSSTAAANSPCCSKAVRIAAAATSETTNIPAGWVRASRTASAALTSTGRKTTASPPLTGGAAALTGGDRPARWHDEAIRRCPPCADFRGSTGSADALAGKRDAPPATVAAPLRLSNVTHPRKLIRGQCVLRYMSQHSTYSPLTPENLREQALRVREHARHLTGDPAADRLFEFADELAARADAMDEPTVRLSPEAAAYRAAGALPTVR
jgi:hypothetical protein